MGNLWYTNSHFSSSHYFAYINYVHELANNLTSKQKGKKEKEKSVATSAKLSSPKKTMKLL